MTNLQKIPKETKMADPKKKKLIELHQKKIEWDYLCQNVPWMKGNTDLFTTDQVIANNLISMKGEGRNKLIEKIYKIVDHMNQQWYHVTRSYSISGPKVAQCIAEIEGTPYRIRVKPSSNGSINVACEISTDHGLYSDDGIIIKSVYPEIVMASFVGKRAEEIFENKDNAFDGDRVIISAQKRLKTTFLKFKKEPERLISICLRDFVRRPETRYEELISSLM